MLAFRPGKYGGTYVGLYPATNDSGSMIPEYWNHSIFEDLDLGPAEKVYFYKIVYFVVTIFCIALCFVSFLINLPIVFCIPYLKGPLSSTTVISISLSVSDTLSSGLIATNFIVNSLLPKVFDYAITNECTILIIEASRLSGILISTSHVLILAINHCVGVNWPLRVSTIMTTGTQQALLLMAWCLPPLYVFTYFSLIEGQGFQRADCHIDPMHNFLHQAAFRQSFLTIFGGMTVIMTIIYIRVYVLVRKHNARLLWFTRHSRQRGGGQDGQGEGRQRNVKAFNTSILVLLVYLVCFVPTVIQYGLVCHDCVLTYDSIDFAYTVTSSSTTNLLLLAKYVVVPIIYIKRMPEIKAALREMRATWKRRICFFRYPEDDLGLPPLRPDQRKWYQFSFMSRLRRSNDIELRTIRIQDHGRRAQYNVTEV